MLLFEKILTDSKNEFLKCINDIISSINDGNIDNINLSNLNLTLTCSRDVYSLLYNLFKDDLKKIGFKSIRILDDIIEDDNNSNNIYAIRPLYIDTFKLCNIIRNNITNIIRIIILPEINDIYPDILKELLPKDYIIKIINNNNNKLLKLNNTFIYLYKCSIYMIPVNGILNMFISNSFKDFYLYGDPTCAWIFANALIYLQKYYLNGFIHQVIGIGTLSKYILELLIKHRRDSVAQLIINNTNHSQNDLNFIPFQLYNDNIIIKPGSLQPNQYSAPDLSQLYTINDNTSLDDIFNDHYITNPLEVQSTTPLEVQSKSFRPADSSFNYLSLKSITTPGDRGEVSDGSSIMGMMEDGSKDVLDVTSSGKPGSDLRELEGEVNKKATTASGKEGGKTSGGKSSRVGTRSFPLDIDYGMYINDDALSLIDSGIKLDDSMGEVLNISDIIGVCIIFDRKVDLITPMCTNFTYEGILDNIIGIDDKNCMNISVDILNGRVYNENDLISGYNNINDINVVKTINLNSNLYNNIKWLDYNDVGKYLHDKALLIKSSSTFAPNITERSEVREDPNGVRMVVPTKEEDLKSVAMKDALKNEVMKEEVSTLTNFLTSKNFLPPTENFLPTMNFPSSKKFPSSKNFPTTEKFPSSKNFPTTEKFPSSENFPHSSLRSEFRPSLRSEGPSSLRSSGPPPSDHRPTLSEVGDFIKRFKLLQEDYHILTIHINIMSWLNNYIKSQRYQLIKLLEDDILQGNLNNNNNNNSNNNIINIKYLLWNKKLDNPLINSILNLITWKIDIINIYRLIILSSQINDGINEYDFNLIKKYIIHQYGLYEIFNIQNYIKSGLIKINNNINILRWNKLINKFNLLVHKDYSINDYSNIYGGYAPLSLRCIQLIILTTIQYRKPLISEFTLLNTNISSILQYKLQQNPLEVQSNTPLEVQSNSFRPADSSFNYLSLKSKATPGDRGEIPAADLREAEGEVNREAVCRTTSGGSASGKEGGVSTGPQVEPAADLREAKGEVNREGHHGEWKETTSGGDKEKSSSSCEYDIYLLSYIGGITLGEVAAVNSINSLNNKNKYIILTTNIINYKNLIS